MLCPGKASNYLGWQGREASCLDSVDSVGGYRSHLCLWQCWDRQFLAAEAAQGGEGVGEMMAKGPTNPPLHPAPPGQATGIQSSCDTAPTFLHSRHGEYISAPFTKWSNYCPDYWRTLQLDSLKPKSQHQCIDTKIHLM